MASELVDSKLSLGGLEPGNPSLDPGSGGLDADPGDGGPEASPGDGGLEMDPGEGGLETDPGEGGLGPESGKGVVGSRDPGVIAAGVKGAEISSGSSSKSFPPPYISTVAASPFISSFSPGEGSFTINSCGHAHHQGRSSTYTRHTNKKHLVLGKSPQSSAGTVDAEESDLLKASVIP